jgi:hypothetical protein
MVSRQGRGIASTLLAKANHFFFVFGYLWLLLSVYALHNSIVLADWRLVDHLWPAMLKALIFTKFLLIGEHLKLGARFEKKPLIWPVLIKAALFSILLIGFDSLEVVTVNAIWPHAVNAGDGPELTGIRTTLSFALMAFVALIPFFGIRELSNVLGHEQMRDLFFHDRTKLKLAPKA